MNGALGGAVSEVRLSTAATGDRVVNRPDANAEQRRSSYFIKINDCCVCCADVRVATVRRGHR